MHPPPPPRSLHPRPPRTASATALSSTQPPPASAAPLPSPSLDAQYPSDPAAGDRLSGWFLPSPVFASPVPSPRPDECAIELPGTVEGVQDEGNIHDSAQRAVVQRCTAHGDQVKGVGLDCGAVGSGLGISLSPPPSSPPPSGRVPHGGTSQHRRASTAAPLSSVPSTPSPTWPSDPPHQDNACSYGHGSRNPAAVAFPVVDSALHSHSASLSARYRRGYSIALLSPALPASAPSLPSSPPAFSSAPPFSTAPAAFSLPMPSSSTAAATTKIYYSLPPLGKRVMGGMGSVARSAILKMSRRRVIGYLLIGAAVWALGRAALRGSALSLDKVSAEVPAGRLLEIGWWPDAQQQRDQGSGVVGVGDGTSGGGGGAAGKEEGESQNEGRDGGRARPIRKSSKLKTAMQKEAARGARVAAQKAKKLAALMPLGGVGRRFRYGANFQPSADEQSGQKWESTNSKLNKALDPKKLHELGRQHHLATRESWSSYAWQPPTGGESTGPGGVHESLVPWINGLEDWEAEVRGAVWRVREWAAQGQSVGLATPEGPSFDRQPPFRRALGDAPEASLAKLANFSAGSRFKWSDLLEEETASLRGGSTAAHACGPEASSGWMRDYVEAHQAATSEEAPGRFLTYICETGSNCGGLGDRLLGMTSGFLFALVTGRAFHAEWQSPVPVDAIFDAPHFDWSFSSFEERPVFGRPDLAGQVRELDVIHFDAESTDKVFGTRDWNAPLAHGVDGGNGSTEGLTKGLEARDLAFASPWIKFFTNRGLIYRSFGYKRIRGRLAALGLKSRSAFSCVLSYLFTPKRPARDFINAYGSLFSLPSVFSVGVQIRTGDVSMKDPAYDRRNTVDLHADFFRCADELAETYALPGQKVVYYLVTDSQHLREDARRQLGSKVVVSGLGIQHVHQKSGHADGVHNAVVEEWILAKTDYRVITQDSGFGKLASFAAGKLGSTVTIFPQSNPDVLALKGKKARTKVDCTRESAFVTFDQLASEWSLG